MKIGVVGPAGGNARDRSETGADDNIGRDADRSVDEFPRLDSLGNMNRECICKPDYRGRSPAGPRAR